MNEANTIGFEIGHDNELQLVKKFKSFQRQYLTVYLTVMGADWLQGPYLYKLYNSYGLELTQIAMLFLTGFVSGAFAGTAVGSLADTWGRKRICIVFCFTILTALSLRMINIYMFLFCSHVLSGVSTALLYSVFESWYVSEHTSRGFPSEWRTRTFALGTLLNSVVAILAGILANALVDLWGFRAPYIASMSLVCFVATMVSSTWTENYGNHQIKVSLHKTLMAGLKTMLKSKDIIIIGLAQTLFECSMYIFVLLYIPAVEDTISNVTDVDIENVPLGYLFSTMMLAVMVGSLFFQTMERQAKSGSRFFIQFTEDRLLSIALGLASCAFMSMAYHQNVSATVLIVAYHVFEFTTGLYYPSISSLKADAIPEETRAAVMTLLRIPMNLAVGVVMWHIQDMSHAVLFSICGMMTSIGCFLVGALYHY
ncbi:Molybdate-anion transporter [Rhizopus stolonifer]|uniref:Molybdate-anion transporter n=1 Tax=Rhizopus stolonifer TaxID=4846 RepID=A0A367KP39_RHIST|nr:Molybdate-anion transporter [Rhizopus stolonifer]